jgi:hypothetical protein
VKKRITPARYNVLVWINPVEAKIFQFDVTDLEGTLFGNGQPHQHILHEAPVPKSARLDREFLEHVAEAIGRTGTVLITGPDRLKKDLLAYIKSELPDLAKRIAGIEAMETPTRGALLAYARCFLNSDPRAHRKQA